MASKPAVIAYGTYGSGWKAKRMFYEREVRGKRRHEIRTGNEADWSRTAKRLWVSAGHSQMGELNKMIAQADREISSKSGKNGSAARLPRGQRPHVAGIELLSIPFMYGLGVVRRQAQRRLSTEAPEVRRAATRYVRAWDFPRYPIDMQLPLLRAERAKRWYEVATVPDLRSLLGL